MKPSSQSLSNISPASIRQGLYVERGGHLQLDFAAVTANDSANPRYDGKLDRFHECAAPGGPAQ